MLGHRILVPLDGSAFAERALPLVTAMARHVGGAVHLVGVHIPWVGTEEPPVNSMMADFFMASRDKLAAYLERVADGLRESGIAVETELRTGRAEKEILSACGERGSDLIAMATHGRSGFDRLWLGSVADRVMRRATVPVLMVSAAGSSDADETPSAIPLDTAPRDVRTIIIPLDGSSLAEEALVPATALGEAFDAEYILARVVSPFTVPGTSPLQAEGPWESVVEEERAAVRRQMEEIAVGMRDVGYRVTVIVSDDDHPVRAILRLVTATRDSVLAMATHGRGGLRRAFMGSTADKLVRSNTRPMLLVRPSDVRDEPWPQGSSSEARASSRSIVAAAHGSRTAAGSGTGWSVSPSTATSV